MNFQFGFIGCGNMGGALATAVSKVIPPAQIALCDADVAKAEALSALTGAHVATLASVASSAEFLFLGVKPQGMQGLLASIHELLAERKTPPILISMAAGLSIDAIEKFVDLSVPVIRIMPNTPVSVGEGMILFACNTLVEESVKQRFLQALSAAGTLDEIPEDKIDAASALSGCGPAFVYLFAEALADGAVACGLAREKANLYAAQTLRGAAELLLQTKQHPGVLKDAVCSPGGTTIVGVHALESGAFRASAINAVTSAYHRTLELKK